MPAFGGNSVYRGNEHLPSQKTVAITKGPRPGGHGGPTGHGGAKPQCSTTMGLGLRRWPANVETATIAFRVCLSLFPVALTESLRLGD